MRDVRRSAPPLCASAAPTWATARAALVVCRRRIHHDTANAAVAATLRDACAADNRRSRSGSSAASPRPDAIAGMVLSRPRPISRRAAGAVAARPGSRSRNHALVQKPIGRSVNAGWTGWPRNACAAPGHGARRPAADPGHQLGGSVERLAVGDRLHDGFQCRRHGSGGTHAARAPHNFRNSMFARSSRGTYPCSPAPPKTRRYSLSAGSESAQSSRRSDVLARVRGPGAAFGGH